MHDLIRINGFLYKLTDEGRFRRHWKNTIRTNDSIMLSSKKKGICPECGKSKELTVDHDPPLRESVDNPKKILICKDCHKSKNFRESRQLTAKVGNYIQSCGRGHNTYLREDLSIYCRVCKRVVNQLEKIGDNEYRTVGEQNGKRN